MNFRSIYLAAFVSASICLGNCSSSTSESNLKDELEKVAGSGDTKAGGNSCLLSYVEKLDQLLTADLAGEASGYKSEEAKVDYSKVLKNPSTHQVRYAWKGDRKKTMNIAGMDRQIPVDDEVILFGIKAVSREDFKRNRRNATDEEVAAMNAQIEKALSGKSDNEAVNKQLEKLEKMGVDKKSVASTGSAIGGLAARVAQSYSEVAGLGDAAAWNSYEQKLYVLQDGVEFSVSVNIGDENTNQEKSIGLARKILQICK